MNRAFLSLYFFIVISVVLIGWGLDKFWEGLDPPAESTAEVRDLITLLDMQLRDLPSAQQRVLLDELRPHLQHRLHIIHIDDLASTSMAASILAGEIVPVATGDAQQGWYKRLGHSQHILIVMAPAPDTSYSAIYSGLLVVFYLGIAVVIFLWIWPLSRDLNKLEKQTRHIGRDGALEPIIISPRSTVYPLAAAFNNMAQRIRELISSHKEMTYAVSHELRTPLARMKFALAMNEDASKHDKEQQALIGIRQDIVEMESLISSLLLYAGFEQSTGQLDRRAGHMKELVEEIINRLVRDRPTELTLEIIDRTPDAIFICEWKLMETAIQNLLQNAMRFAHRHVCIELVATTHECSVAIADDGPGIPVADRERVFDSFIRLYNEDATQTGGFGLGLAIVRRIIGWHGGEVLITDSEWQGAKVIMKWPKGGLSL